MKIREALTFDDILLEPSYDCGVPKDTSVEIYSENFDKIKLNIPILSAAMDTVTEVEMAIELGKLGGMGVIHRNMYFLDQAKMVRKAKEAGVLVGAAIGVSKQDHDRARAVHDAGADILFIDLASAHAKRTVEFLRWSKQELSEAKIIVGNIATPGFLSYLDEFPQVIGVKVGIGPGSICTTRIVAGVGVPQLTAILDVVEEAKEKKLLVIADGGIRTSGDIVKALAAGADLVMLGSLLSGTDETPGELVTIDGPELVSFQEFLEKENELDLVGGTYRGNVIMLADKHITYDEKIAGKIVKKYRGMGSPDAMAKTDRYGTKTPEGVAHVVKYKGPLKDIVEQLVGGIKAGMAYIGANNIKQMRYAKFVRITNAGLAESKPHILK